MVSGGSGDWRSRGRREAMPNPVSRTSPSRAVHQDIGRLDVLVDEAALVDLAQSRRRCRWRGAGSVPPPWARRAADRAARRRDPRAPAWSDRLRARAPAAAPPTPRPARPSIRIRGRGDRGLRATGALRQAERPARRSGCRHRPGATLGRTRVRRPLSKPETCYPNTRRSAHKASIVRLHAGLLVAFYYVPPFSVLVENRAVSP